MDPQLYRAAQEGNWDVISLFGRQLYTQQTPEENTVLHVVAQFCDSSLAVEQILREKPKLLLKLNAEGETSLHVAAREGHCNVVRALNDCAKQKSQTDWSSMLTSRTMNGNSVLHEAVNNNRHDIVQFLLQEYPMLIGITNWASESPLYVAVEKGYEDLAALILSTCKLHPEPAYHFYELVFLRGREYKLQGNWKHSFLTDSVFLRGLVYILQGNWKHSFLTNSCDGPGWKTALQAAAKQNSPESVELILEQFPNLTNKVDKHGWTPLHHAARFNYQGVAKILLQADPSAAYVKSKPYNFDGNKDGKQTALHVAVTHGHVQVMEELLLQCPDCWEMVTKQGKNVIHLAVENEHQGALEFILVKSWAAKLVNKKDRNGNTPLHLYATTMQLQGFNLINHPVVDKNLLNNACLTPLDLIIDAIDQVKESSHEVQKSKQVEERQVRTDAVDHVKDAINQVKGRQILIKNELERAGAIAIQGYGNVVSIKKEPEDDGQDYGRLSETYMVVVALIITITFAAGFTIPGGYESSDGPRKGMAVLAKKAAFMAFISTDALAMMFSLYAMFLLLLPAKKSTRREVLQGCSRAIGCALVALVISFTTGLYVAIPNSGFRIFLFAFLWCVCPLCYGVALFSVG